MGAYYVFNDIILCDCDNEVFVNVTPEASMPYEHVKSNYENSGHERQVCNNDMTVAIGRDNNNSNDVFFSTNNE